MSRMIGRALQYWGRVAVRTCLDALKHVQDAALGKGVRACQAVINVLCDAQVLHQIGTRVAPGERGIGDLIFERKFWRSDNLIT